MASKTRVLRSDFNRGSSLVISIREKVYSGQRSGRPLGVGRIQSGANHVEHHRALRRQPHARQRDVRSNAYAQCGISYPAAWHHQLVLGDEIKLQVALLAPLMQRTTSAPDAFGSPEGMRRRLRQISKPRTEMSSVALFGCGVAGRQSILIKLTRALLMILRVGVIGMVSMATKRSCHLSFATPERQRHKASRRTVARPAREVRSAYYLL